MNLARRLQLSAVLILLLCATLRADDRGVIVLGKARLTVITPNLIRIEYNPQGRFIDDRSLFAIDRSARHAVDVDGGNSYHFDTQAIRMSVPPDPKLEVIEAEIRVGDRWVKWKAGDANDANL